MEINNFSPPTIVPVRAPSTVEDGDAGPNSPYYRRRQKKARSPREDVSEETSPQLEGSPSHIDIRV
jgi:hypothetical protein